MNILVVASTKTELIPLFKHFKLDDLDYVETKGFDILISGVGMVATAFALGNQLALKKYNLILNLGIAGCFDTDYTLGSVFQISKDSFGDLGAEDNDCFIPIKKMGFGESTHHATENIEIELPVATSITVNTVSGSSKTIENRRQNWQVLTESMEGAAVFYAASKSGIPAIQIRSISNYIEPRNTNKWEIELAVKNLNNWAIDFLANQMRK